MKAKHKRLTFVGVGVLLLAGAAGLVLAALEDTVVFFFSPTELRNQIPAPDRTIRIGGLVEQGSLERGGNPVRFRITDLKATVPVTYRGLLPDLIREGQGVVASGRLVRGTLEADEVLAKHDENYMPKEVADALRKAGTWQGGS